MCIRRECYVSMTKYIYISIKRKRGKTSAKKWAVWWEKKGRRVRSLVACSSQASTVCLSLSICVFSPSKLKWPPNRRNQTWRRCACCRVRWRRRVFVQFPDRRTIIRDYRVSSFDKRAPAIINSIDGRRHLPQHPHRPPVPTRSIDSLNIQVQSVAEIDTEDTPVPRNIRSVSIGSLYQRAASATTTTTTGGTYKVLEYLHCGTTESSTDAALLCRLHITYIIGFSRSSNQHEHRSMPCACPKLHQRVEMQLDIGDNDASTPPDAIVACFDDVNRFIAAARSHAKQVHISLRHRLTSSYLFRCICFCRCSYSAAMHVTAVKRSHYNISCSIFECVLTMRLHICKRITYAFSWRRIMRTRYSCGNDG